MEFEGGAMNNAESGGHAMDKYPHGIPRATDWKTCMNYCNKVEAGCKSWTYRYSTGVCWLKDTGINSKPWDYKADAISGLR